MKKIILVAFILLACIQGQTQVPSQLFGMTRFGGDGFGTIYATDNNGNNAQLIETFRPNVPGELPETMKPCFGPNGKLYGLTPYGGAFNQGVLFEYDTLTGIFTKKYDFKGSNGAYPLGSVMLASDGMLYGLTSAGGNASDGVLFQFNPVTNTYTKKADLNASIGAEPYGSLMQASDGMLYGMTSVGGTNNAGVIFRYNPVTSAYTKMIDLVTINGIYPHGTLMQATDGFLYGLTYNGGTTGNGVLFRYDPVTNTYLKRVDMTATNGAHPSGALTQAPDGNLYSVTYDGGTGSAGAIFMYNPVTNVYTKKLDLTTTGTGKNSTGYLLMALDGSLYGLTYLNGPGSGGILFQYNYSTNVLTNRYTFTTNGYSPAGGLVQSPDGKMYGCTRYGGSVVGGGVFFRFDPGSNIYTKLGEFDTALGVEPACTFMQASDGMLYGTTMAGGTNYTGTIFRFDPVTYALTRLYSFLPPTGNAPFGKLVQGPDGNLYGCTTAGGTSSLGVLYQYNLTTNVYTKKYDFNSSQGLQPFAGMIVGFDGLLYGVTGSGGVNNGGVIFTYNTATNVYTKKIDMLPANGAGPIGSLVQLSDTMMYGTTQSGGLYNMGVVFQYDPRTNIYTKKADLNSSTGGEFYGELTLGNDGKLYGVTNYYAANMFGSIVCYDPATNVFVKKLDLTSVTGVYPKGGLMLSSNGKFYGMCNAGGASNNGTMFEYDPVANVCTPKINFSGANGWQPDYNDLFEYCEAINIQEQPLSSAICLNDSLAVHTSALGTNLSYQWYLNDSPVAGATSPFFIQPHIHTEDTGAYYCIITNGCRTTRSFIANISLLPAPVISFTLATDSLCETDGLSILSASPAGGTFTGIGVSGNTFDPQISGTGQFPVTYTCVDSTSGCISSVTNTITVVSLPEITFTLSPASICAGASPVVLNASPAGGIFSGTGVSGNEFSPEVAGTGVHIISYTASSLPGCMRTATDTIEVLSLPAVSLGFALDTVCFTAGLVNLSGTPAGGIFSGPGVTASSFDPQAAGVGDHSISYVFTDTNGCSNAATGTIHVEICSGLLTASGATFTLFPNPADDGLSLQLEAFPATKTELKMYNAQGQLTYSCLLESGQKQYFIPVSNLADGIYLLCIESDNMHESIPVIVQH